MEGPPPGRRSHRLVSLIFRQRSGGSESMGDLLVRSAVRVQIQGSNFACLLPGWAKSLPLLDSLVSDCLCVPWELKFAPVYTSSLAY